MRRGARGQALIEFALVVPVLLLIIWVFITVAAALMTRGTVGSVTQTITQQAARSGGEDASVDDLVQSAASQNGLALSRLLVRIDTAAGAGAWHYADWHDTGADHSSVYPPPAPWGTPVQVHLRYADPIAIPFLGTQVLSLPGDGIADSQYGEDLRP